jgi:hypothetical protein
MSKQQQISHIDLEESIVPATGGDGMLSWPWWLGGGGAAVILSVIIIIIP